MIRENIKHLALTHSHVSAVKVIAMSNSTYTKLNSVIGACIQYYCINRYKGLMILCYSISIGNSNACQCPT